MSSIDLTDITSNLPSVQFESALTEEQLLENNLRNKSHCLLYLACAQSLYFVSSLNEFRENRLLVLHPNDKKLANRLLRDLEAKEPLLVGIIGFGRLGSRLASLLLKGSGLLPEELKISTRRPELASELAAAGAACSFDNAGVASSVHLLFLCCPPAAVASVADDIRGHLSPRTVVCCHVTGYRERKLRQLLDHEAVICPAYDCQPDLARTWPMPPDVAELLARQPTAEAACPVPRPPEAPPEFVGTRPKLVALWLYAVANLCTFKRHTVDETLSVINHVFVRSAIRPKVPDGEEPPPEPDEATLAAEAALLLRPRDLIRGLDTTDEFLPIFDLAEISLQATYLEERFERDQALCRAFTERFCQRLTTAWTRLRFHTA